MLVLLLFTVSKLIGQQIFHYHYTTKDNLPHDITYQIIQDDKGYIWIGTDDGLSKFNGTSFVNYSYENGLRSNYVIDITQNKDSYYIATWGGGLHQLKNDSIYTLTETDKNNKIKKLIQLNDSIIYTHTNGEISKYNVHKKTYERSFLTTTNDAPTTPILAKTTNINGTNFSFNVGAIDHQPLIFSAENIIKTTTPISGILRIENNVLTPYFKNIFKDKEIHSITQQKDGTLYVSSFNTIFTCRDSKISDKKQFLSANFKIFNLFITEDNIYFIANNQDEGTREMYKYDLKKDTLVNLSKALNIHSLISDFLIDKDKGLWITTYGQGLYYIPDVKSLFLGKSFFGTPDLRDLVKYKNTLIALSPNDLYGLQNDTLFAAEKLPFHSQYLQLDTLKQEIKLISSYKGKIKFTYDWKNSIKVQNSKVFEVQDKNTNLCLKFRSNELTTYKNDSLVAFIEVQNFDTYVRDVLEYNNNIYVIYNNLGIYIFEKATGKLLHIWDKATGFFTNQFRDIAQFEDQFWLASDVGIIKVQGTEKVRYTTKNGLSSNHINDVHVDQFGVVWAGTQKGLNALHQDSFYTLDESTGQQSSFITKVIEDGNFIYASGNKGLFKYDNSKAFQPTSKTTILIQQEGPQFTIDKLNFSNANSVTLEYRLDANEWEKVLSQNINFNQLRQGTYQLQIRAKDPTSPWIYSKKYAFKVQVPWHQQVWFYISVLTLIAGSILYVILKRLQIARQKNKVFQQTLEEREQLQLELRNVRHQIAQDFHDDLGNKLASISIASNLLVKNHVSSDSPIKKRLTQIKEDADTLYNGMRDFVWSLNYKNNKLSELQMYLSDFGEELFEHSNITFKSYNNLPSENLAISYYWNKQLVLIFKEAMTNAFKHSKASEVIFDVQLTDQNVSISVHDNGIGWQHRTSKKINGIQNMKDRARSIKGNLAFIEDNGLKVVFTASIKNNLQQK